MRRFLSNYFDLLLYQSMTYVQWEWQNGASLFLSVFTILDQFYKFLVCCNHEFISNSQMCMIFGCSSCWLAFGVLYIDCIALCGLCAGVENQSKPDSEAAARGEGRAGWAGCHVSAPGGVAEPRRTQTRGERANTSQQLSCYWEGTCVSAVPYCKILKWAYCHYKQKVFT